MRYDFVVLVETLTSIILKLPRFRIFNFMKSLYFKVLGNNIGKNIVYYPGLFIMPPKNLNIGNNVDLAKDVLITASGGVSIGDRTLIGYGTKILTSNHNIPTDQNRIIDAGHTHEPVIIEKDVWIGSNCVILPGVTVKEGSVIAAGSIVTKDTQPFSIYAGVPAKKIKDRK